ncbi:MAG: type II toxin-antitoxin system ParD family antitoxin [Methylocystis sp.]|nr:MAG: type II toxin-antitoxin system ParD family antitoxin [Methylocystis sp.]
MSGHLVQISLPEDLAAEVSAAVERGEYASETDALLGAVEEWRAQRQVDAIGVEELRRLVREGIESGPGLFESFEDIRAEARRRFQGR